MNLKKIYSIRYFFYVIIIVFVSIYLILLTYGYRINWENFSLQKISAMYIASIPRDVNVKINSKITSQSTPVKITNLFPGRYDVKIEHNYYHTWEKTLFIKPDYVEQEQDIILILKDKEEIKMKDEEIKLYNDIFNNKEKMENQRKGLYINNNSEIFFKDVLVTRLSKKIKNLVWYADKKHIIYQIDNQIYFMDSDSSNNILLVELSSDEDANFISTDEGKYLIYKDGDDIKKIQITNINSLLQEKYFNRASKIIK